MLQNQLLASELRHPAGPRDAKCYEWGRWQCSDFHTTPFPIRCRDYNRCSLCRKWRESKVYAIGMTRWKLSPWGKVNIPLVFWTLGTNWFDTKENRRKLAVSWKSFRKAIWRLLEKPPAMLVRVYEAGSLGNYLHVHFLAEQGYTHAMLIRVWRKIVRLKANVHYSFPRVCNNCGTLNPNDSNSCKQCAHSVYTSYIQWYSRLHGKSAFGYALKYVSKASSSYFWQGSILKVEMPPWDDIGYCKLQQCDMSLDHLSFDYNPRDVLR